LHVVRPGWSFDTLVPYLLRDWTGTFELQVTSARIGAALKHVFPDPRGKSVAFAGCGAGGLLAEISGDFERILGFDLTLPILAAARQLLDGKTLDLPLPRVLNESGLVSLHRRDPRLARQKVELIAMDALDMAFANQSVDCVVSVFLTDILPDPSALAHEVHRVLSENGIWINYGPSGNNLRALWRFDQTEAAAFFATAGFTVLQAKVQRGTNLDLTGVCPLTSFRNAMFYLTIARKIRKAEATAAARTPGPDELWEIVPRHFPGARLVHRLESGEGSGILLQHDRNPERAESWELGGRAARMMVLVDGLRTIGEIAVLLFTVVEDARVQAAVAPNPAPAVTGSDLSGSEALRQRALLARIWR
jgi:SAM-dependent methyltransferase